MTDIVENFTDTDTHAVWAKIWRRINIHISFHQISRKDVSANMPILSLIFNFAHFHNCLFRIYWESLDRHRLVHRGGGKNPDKLQAPKEPPSFNPPALSATLHKNGDDHTHLHFIFSASFCRTLAVWRHWDISALLALLFGLLSTSLAIFLGLFFLKLFLPLLVAPLVFSSS